MGLADHFEPLVTRRVLGAAFSAVLHIGLILLIALSGSGPDGLGSSPSSFTQLVLIEAPDADQRDGLDLPPLEPEIAPVPIEEPLQPQMAPPQSLPEAAIPAELAEQQVASVGEPPPATGDIATNAIRPAPTLVMGPAEQAALSDRLARLAEEFAQESRTDVQWEQDGKQYSARLILERANEGTALEHVIAEISAADRGRNLTTRVVLKRLAFSQFSQMVDRWDPTVQLHDDVIVGRFHSNSRFNVLNDAHTKPQFLGKVTTAARSFDLQLQGRGRESDIFRGGVETRTSRIPLPEELQPSEWAPQDANARVHDLTDNTRIRFFADGSYSWRTQGSPAPQYLNAPSEHPVYFIAARGATLYVQGVVAGMIMVYSPHKIVVEGNLTYAHDPRRHADSRDYLGLVSDRYIEVAPPSVTGPGDLQIQAAILAGRRFNVTSIDHHRSATLRIYGSLAAGSLSASEPRYSTRIEYDGRFEQRRPPGFPSTNRYEVDGWNGEWTEALERSPADAL